MIYVYTLFASTGFIPNVVDILAITLAGTRT